MSGDLPSWLGDLPPLGPPGPPTGLPDWLAGGDLPPPPAAPEPPGLPEPPLAQTPPPVFAAPLPEPPALTRTPPPVRKPLAIGPPALAGRQTRTVSVEPTPEANGTLAFRLVVRPDPGVAFADCRVWVPLPAGLKQVIAGRKPTPKNGGLYWNLGHVRSRQEVGLFVRYPAGHPDGDGPRPFTLTFDPEPTPMLGCEPAAPEVVPAGRPFPATVRVWNAGGAASGRVTVTVKPTGGRPVVATLPPLDPGAERTAAFTLAGVAGRPTWSVTVTDGEDTVSGSLVVTAVLPTVAVELALPSAVRVDDPAELSVVVRNPTGVPVDGLTVRCELPPELTFDAADEGRFDPITSRVEWDIPELSADGARTLVVRVRGFAPGFVGVRATAEADGGVTAAASGSLFCDVDTRSLSTSVLDALLAAAPAFAADEDVAARPAEATGLRHLLFDLAGTRYAVPLANVSEVIRPPVVTPVPGTPDWLLGLANVRGDIVSIVDLALFLRLDPTPAARPAVLLTQTDDADRTVGLRVDAVAGLRRLPADLPPPPAGLDDEPVAAFLSGLAADGERVLPRIDLHRLLRAADPTHV